MIRTVRDADHSRRIGRRDFGLLVGGALASPLLAACGGDSGDGGGGGDRGGGGSAAPTTAAPAPERIAYGGQPDQFGELTFPRTRGLPRATVVVHGGFWRTGTDLSLMRPIASALVAAGFVTWNIEYRRVGSGGGWPSTFDDVALATDRLAEVGSTRIDLRRVFVLGHSAGGHLAAWLAMRARLAPGEPGAAPVVRPAGVISQAGVLDLATARRSGADGGAVADLVAATPASDPARYRATSPAEALPLGVPTVCVHGTADEVVPIAQSERFVEAATAAGDRAELVRVDGADHLQLIDVAHPAWTAALRALEGLAG
ncbi:putative lipase/esterase [Pseudonocardia sp. Ae168_Ps1]|nr:putative lipase/esterase [Pseudonocardia sp. Ae150A_Ps1]OLL79132.1 putative lipase/esterase [Pseudonocardia sp. Ae168_Ps1]OLL86731.1 putative lipase/esterase [Pseudonocardia sp. Ae263_Ps1]OLL93224.1 putative lipase/esterase [Pseudonocardia sp. Ae356_Ps1]